MAPRGTKEQLRHPIINRRNLLIGGFGTGLCTAAALYAGNASGNPDGRMSSPSDLLWGVCGHPFTAYPGISLEQQLDLVKKIGFTHYRVDFQAENLPQMADEILTLAKKRRVTILPILASPVDIKDQPPETIFNACYEAGRRLAEKYRNRIRIWEIGNEEENFAIVQPCERRDDGTQYPCEWGPAGGVGPLEYFGPRWKKVSAVLAGLSQGVKAGDPEAIVAMGTAGWGHLGAFDRLVEDKVEWDITVWHDYETVGQDALAKLATFQKPIWITEFNAGSGGEQPPEVNASMLTERIAHYRSVRVKYNVAAAFIYELLDEPYWEGFEAKQGLVSVQQTEDGTCVVGGLKPAGAAVQKAI